MSREELIRENLSESQNRILEERLLEELSVDLENVDRQLENMQS